MAPSSPDLSIICASSLESQRQKAFELSTRLALPLQEKIDESYRFHLVYTDYRLELQYNPLLLAHKEYPVSVDFLQGEKIHRRIATSSLRSPLAKAAGLKTGYRPFIADATAGLGMDAITLAWLGCRVLLIERNPILHALLENGIERTGANRLLTAVIAENIRLVHGDSTEILPALDPPADSIVVDPMYPQAKKGPLNKKEMRLLRAIAGDDADGGLLFKTALRHARKRVAVKRPKGAPAITIDAVVSHSIAMRSGRFDVYLTQAAGRHL